MEQVVVLYYGTTVLYSTVHAATAQKSNPASMFSLSKLPRNTVPLYPSPASTVLYLYPLGEMRER